MKHAFDLGSFLPYKLTVAAEILSSGFSRLYKEKYGISVAEWRVLVHVADADTVSIREIHQRVHLEKSKASRAAARLEKAGYLTKQENSADRRLIVLALTDAGRALMDELLGIAVTYQARIDALLGDTRAALDDALEQIIDDGG
jgi:DNA-binding MarR family transcriptional regulator